MDCCGLGAPEVGVTKAGHRLSPRAAGSTCRRRRSSSLWCHAAVLHQVLTTLLWPWVLGHTRQHWTSPALPHLGPSTPCVCTKPPQQRLEPAAGRPYGT